jgi:hypothetical protein
MANGSVDITVHIDETLDHARLQKVAEQVRNSVGVTAAVFHDTKPHFLLVQYDPAKLTSDALHHLFVEQGVHAEMIGL